MNDTEAIEDDEGNRIFKIQLPSGKKVEATVDPSLKMMDLLISIASNNKLNPTAYQIAQPSKLKGRPPLVYTPSQSAGDIEGSFIMLLPKKEREQFSIYKGKKSGVFEHTVRLTIHSSKNHKMIFRTNPDKTLGEVFPKICEERGVEESHYVMRVHKHKEDADPTQTIQSFGVLDFDLVEVENEGKKKVGLLGKLKKKEDEDERTEKSKPNANGSHNNHRSPPENKVQKQNSDGTVHHKPDGGVPSKPDGVTSHKKRPAPLPPSVSTANIQPSDVQAQSNTLEKSKPKVSRVSTKKRRAPAAPVAVVPINIEESSEQKKETTGDKEGVVDNSQRVGGHDESDAPSQVGIDRGQSMEVVTDGAPPSPAVSHGSSQGLSTSDKDKSSVTGSVSEHDNQGSIPPAPSKPPRLNLYSDEEIDAEFKLEGKPVFVPPSPPLTPPSASVPTEDVRKLIAEGRLSIEEDYPDGDASTNPDSSSVHDDEQFSSEENLASSHQSLDDIDGEIEIILAKVDGPEVKVAKTDSVAPDEEPKVAEISLGDVNIEGNAGFMVGTLPAELPPPPYVEQVPPPPMPPSPPPIPPEEEYLPVEDDLPPPPDDIPPPPPGEDPPRRKVCKCIDPENGEDCDHYTPGAVIKEGENVQDCPFARNNGDNDGPPGGPPDGPPDGGEGIVLSRGDQPILSEEKKGVTHISPPVEQKFDISSKSNILPKPKRFNLRKEYAHPLENRLSIPKLLDLELSQVGHEKINFESPQESTVAKMLDGYVKEVYENNFCDVQQITSRRLSGLRINKRSDGDLSSSQSLDTDILSQEKIPSSPPPTKPKPVTSPKPDLSSSQSVETEIFFQEKIPSSPPPTKPKPVTSPKPDLSSSQSIETEMLSQEKILSSPPPTKSKPVTSPKPVVLPKPKRFSLSKDVAHPLDNQLSFPKLTDVKLAEVGHEKPVVSDARRRFFSQMFLSANTAITPQTGSMSSKDENAAPDDKITAPTLETDVPVAKNAVLKVVNTAMSPDKAQTENTIPQSEIESKSHSPEKVTSKPDNIALETNNNIPKAGHTMSEFDGTIFKGETNTLPQMELECDIALKPGDIHKADITTQKADITTQKADTTTQKADITTQKADINTQKADTTTQKADITTQKADTTTQKADITTQKEECSKQATSETGKRSDKPKTQLERVKMKPGDKDGPRPPETLALKLSFDDDSNETTSYSATPQEEDVAHEMEDKSLQLAMAASRLAKEEQKKDERKSEEDALSQNVIPPVKKEDGKTTYQMQTDPVPEEVQDLKTMYQKMQAQLGELQQAILSNQGAAQQQPAAVQLQQLQQLQQQMLLQQQLLLQQGMMMPPMMMQTSPPQMMVPMAPHPMMVTPGMQQPYMVPPQQPVVTMTSPVAVAQSTEQPLPSDAVDGVKGSPSSDTVEVKASNLDKGEKELPKRVGSPDINEEIAKEEEKPTSTSVEPATKELSGGGGSDNVEKDGTKTEDSEDIDKSIPAKQTVSSRTESKDGSPSTRRKNVFADILKKKGKQSVKSNYVLSAQKEMLNRQRSESDTKVKSTTQAQLDDRPRSGSDGPSKEGIAMAESSVAGGAIKVNSNSEKKDDKALESTVMKDTKGVRQVEDTSVLSKGSGDIFNGGTPKTEGELPRIEGEIPKTEGEIPKEVTNNVLAKTEESSMVASNVRVGKSLTEDGKPNAKGDNSMAVTEFEAEFAVDTKRKVLSPGVEDDRTVSKSLNNGSVPVEDTSSTSELLPKVPPKVAPKPTSKPPSRPPPPRQDGPRPFRRGTRPVSLASDRQNELQEMAGLSNVSRFKEMMAANLKSKESTN